MRPKTFMLIAGEASGDLLAAELISALREQCAARSPTPPQFFGAGGPKMSAAGVELIQEMSKFSVVGITDVLKKLFELRRLMQTLLAAAIERQPDVIIGVDYGGFNLRFGHAVKEYVRNNPFSTWDPKIVQFVSPQVWASRPGRANRIADDYDLLLSIFPFERDWYAQRVPQLRVEFVGHPMVGRFATDDLLSRRTAIAGDDAKTILLLPGSRKSELKRHFPPMLQAAWQIEQKLNAHFLCVLPNENLLALAKPLAVQSGWSNMVFQIGDLPTALAQADLAVAKTGTVTMECAFFGVPSVTLYKGSWLNYQIARHFITVKTFTMPNLLAGEEVFPEFLQTQLTAENLSRAALELLQDDARRQKIKTQLRNIVASLGEPGAAKRAATAILKL